MNFINIFVLTNYVKFCKEYIFFDKSEVILKLLKFLDSHKLYNTLNK